MSTPVTAHLVSMMLFVTMLFVVASTVSAITGDGFIAAPANADTSAASGYALAQATPMTHRIFAVTVTPSNLTRNRTAEATGQFASECSVTGGGDYLDVTGQDRGGIGLRAAGGRQRYVTKQFHCACPIRSRAPLATSPTKYVRVCVDSENLSSVYPHTRPN